ncbi:MAG: hypothetical protein ACRDK3_13645 [Actinomycetota bacterium]
MKIVAGLLVAAVVLGLRIWGARRRPQEYERRRVERTLPFHRRPATVRTLLAIAVALLAAIAYVSYTNLTD